MFKFGEDLISLTELKLTNVFLNEFFAVLLSVDLNVMGTGTGTIDAVQSPSYKY